jgi:hypothetical protein
MTPRRLLTLLTLLSALTEAPFAQRARQPESATSADVEVWVAALDQIGAEHPSDALALMNKTLTTDEFGERLTNVTSERELVSRLMKLNVSSSLIRLGVNRSVEILDASKLSEHNGRGLKMTRVRSRLARRRARLVQLSLPAFSGDASKALLFVRTTKGFDDISGGGYIFERREGKWIVSGYLAVWST